MSLPATDSASTYGGAGLVDYGGVAVIDPTTDRPAYGVNQLVSSVAGMTHTAIRAIVQFTQNGTGAPTLLYSDATWAATGYVAPTPARASAGVYTFTWPTQVYDEVPAGAPGYTSPQTLVLRGALPSQMVPSGGGVILSLAAYASAANVITFYSNSGTTPTDLTGVNFQLLVY